jgi:hypothetical protein
MLSRKIACYDSLVRRDIYGGKAHWLSWLKVNGFNVPPALFLPINFALQSVYEEWFIERLMDFFFRDRSYDEEILFVLRSSSVLEDDWFESHAGQHKSISQLESVNDVINKIPRIVDGTEESSDLQVGVIIQEYIEASYSGVAFSTHPTRETKNCALIEYVEGNCENLLEGKVTGKRIEVNLAKAAPRKKAGVDLPLGRINEIIDVIKDLEDSLSFPVDVEWAISRETGQLFIIQCRPITNLIFKESQIVKIDMSTTPQIPSRIQNNDKVRLRIRCSESSVPTTDAFLLFINEQDYKKNRLSQLLRQRNWMKESTRGYSSVLIHPMLLHGKIVREFSNNSVEQIESRIDNILTSCFEEYWQAIIIIQELLDMSFMGIIKRLGSSYLIEVAFGGFIQKGITEVSRYVLEGHKVVERTDSVQKYAYDLVDGDIHRFPIHRKIELPKALLFQIIDVFDPIVDENTALEFGISSGKQGLIPYVIDTVDDPSILNVSDISEGIISKGRIQGTVKEISIDKEDNWRDSVDLHFHGESSKSVDTANDNIIYLLERPDIAILDIIGNRDTARIGFLFKQASILSHICVQLREKNIPAMILPNEFTGTITEGSTLIVDTVNLSDGSCITLIDTF